VARRVRNLPVSIGYFRGPLLMSWLRKRWVLLRNPHMPFGGTFVTGEGVEFRRKFRAELAGRDSRIQFGAGTVCTYDVLMQCGTTIVIGERCMFGQSTMVVDGNHRFRDLDKPMLQQGYDFNPIRIADDAVVTTKCTIIADIGTRSFIGANSVVTRPIPPYCLAVGMPAKVIDYFGPEGSEPAELSEANSERSG
jgi:acetyltransferase-like isoleucine patch superfamily enzyme